ncbi:hypothetical protein GCM10028784_15290 [Myceligenerans cantabricum]
MGLVAPAVVVGPADCYEDDNRLRAAVPPRLPLADASDRSSTAVTGLPRPVLLRQPVAARSSGGSPVIAGSMPVDSSYRQTAGGLPTGGDHAVPRGGTMSVPDATNRAIPP